MSKFHTQLLGVVAGVAIVAGTASMAKATPTFTICPNAITGISGYSCTTQSDYNGTSDALIQQTGPTTQMETGWVQGGSFTNNGTGSNFTTTGMLTEPGITNTYNIYITFTATVSGITGFGPNQSGTITQFNFTVYADVGDNDTFTNGTTSSTGGTAPTVTDVGSNDIVLAVGDLISGTAGFQQTTGAPTFNAISDFILCDGTANQGTLGGTTTTATGCGSFDAANYFTAPSPFYSINFDSTTSGSAADIHPGPSSATPPNALLSGIVVDINFEKVPEPSSLLLLGAGILGLGMLARRRRKS